MDEPHTTKTVLWIGSSLKDLKSFPTRSLTLLAVPCIRRKLEESLLLRSHWQALVARVFLR
jgi:hypothetical protein